VTFLSNLPEFEIPVSSATELENKTIDEKVRGQMVFEVIGKGEGNIRIRVKSIALDDNKRIMS